MLLYALTIFVSAFLLFLVQPIIAKQILPWFGGSAAVWTTCMVFFQCVLFAGYAYADWIARRLAIRRQVMVHAVLLAISLISLPIVAGSGWKPSGADDPSWRILGLLTATIGLPYFLLSTTGPLVQAWFARGYPKRTVYRLYALSNLASLLALLAYPFAIEPWVTTNTQAWSWSGAYLVFVLACAASGWMTLRQSVGTFSEDAPETAKAETTPVPERREHLTWLLFSAMGALMLLAVTNHITHDLASVPFLWILPLSLYLLTFILCFEGRNWYKRKYFLMPVILVVGAMGWTLVQVELRMGIPVSLIGLFVICMFFHGELAARKPAPEHLTRFFLMLSLGGALGGLFVGLLAVKLFNANYEFGLGLVLTLVAVAIVVRRVRWVIPTMVMASLAFGGYLLYAQQEYMADKIIVMKRNFYGSLHVRDTNAADPENALRRFVHGVINHGEQFLAPHRQDEPTAYFRPHSGIARALAVLDQPNRRIGIIGLGVGTLATYGRDGDVIRFYEINPDVIEVAQSHFTFLKRSKAKIELVLGDARLELERETPQAYDLIVVDAFSSDSIPVHLATKQALDVYLSHLKPEGVVVFQISNKFLKLAPVLKKIAEARGLHGMMLADPENMKDNYSSEWYLMTANDRIAKHPAFAPLINEVEEIRGVKAWTDDFNNQFLILR